MEKPTIQLSSPGCLTSVYSYTFQNSTQKQEKVDLLRAAYWFIKQRKINSLIDTLQYIIAGESSFAFTVRLRQVPFIFLSE